MKNNDYWGKMLTPDEEILKDFTVSNRFIVITTITVLLLGILTLGILYLGYIIIICGLFYTLFYLKRANRYAFTNKRVLVHKGWLGKTIKMIPYSKITDISVKQQVFEEQGYKTGSILVETAGSASHELLWRVADPYDVQKELINLRDKYK